MQNYQEFEFNPKVLVVLIETGYIQAALSSESNKSEYRKFLITILRETDRNFVKEACCRRIIKFFGKDEKVERDEPDGKIEFINLVEPLAAIMNRP